MAPLKGFLLEFCSGSGATVHVTQKSPGPMCGWVGRILRPDSCNGTQIRRIVNSQQDVNKMSDGHRNVVIR